jgi:hypothetical protein
MPVPNIFGTATSAIPLSQLDTNFATPVTIGNTAVQLGNTVTSFGNVTLTNVTISSGNVTVSAGSNTAPSITTVGDTNTGIFFPAADTIAFTEGGIEAARINSSGVFTTTNDATIQGLTVGRGAGAVSTNTAVGASALAAGTTADFTTAIGHEAALSTTTATRVTAVGSQALRSNTTGRNTALGWAALYSNTTGTTNTALGDGVLYTNTGDANTGAGYGALLLNSSGATNTAVGVSALRSNTTASNNTAVGYQAGYNTTTGNGYNTFIGAYTGYSVTTGAGNTFIGTLGSAGSAGCGYYITTGSNNTIIGGYTGNSNGLDIRTASNYIVLSDGAGNPRGIFDSSGNLLVGTTSSAARITAKAATSDNSGYVTYMDDSAGTLMFYVRNDGVFLTGAKAASPYNNNVGAVRTLMVTSSGVLGYNASTRNTKINIASLTDVNWLFNLEPVSFNYREKDDDNNYTDVAKADVHYGLIAEDAEIVNKDLCFYNEDGSLAGVNYDLLSPALLKAIQELKALVDTQASTITTLTDRITALEAPAAPAVTPSTEGTSNGS